MVDMYTGNKTVNVIHTENDIAIANIPIMIKFRYIPADKQNLDSKIASVAMEYFENKMSI
jgi:hypothetical protein